MKFARLFLIAILLLLSCAVGAQESAKPAQDSAKPMLSPTARLQAAKTITVKRLDGGTLAPGTVSDILSGWGRYQLVSDGKPADLIVEVSSPSEGSSGISVSSSSGMSGGKYEESSKSSRELSSGGGPLRIVVRDSKSNAALFTASEQVKGAMKHNARDNNMVEAVQKIMAKFHDRVEPVKAD